MINIDREDIQIVSRHSNWSEKGISEILKKNIYNDKAAWQQFLRLFFISLGIGFTTAGIIFFFAYNWADLHKFAKLGLISGLIVLLTSVSLSKKINLDIQNILLTGASILVGVLFAVFGQIYQTGANAYDFFLGWTIFIAIWTCTANYYPLWLVFITLINTTFVLYSEQVAHDWSPIFIITALFCINSGFLLSSLYVSKINSTFKTPTWFSNILALAVVSLSTIGICFIIFDGFKEPFYQMLLIVLTGILYYFGVKFSLQKKQLFYISIISLSVIIMISAFFINISSAAFMFFFTGFFIIASVTFVIKTLIDLQKKWMK